MVTNWPAGQRVVFGGDYNPEQWPRTTWEEDVALMREAGVNFVSIGMWAWSLLEPSEGNYNFEDYDHLINLLHDNGIAVDLGTPSASPPSWFYHKYPGARVVHRDGTVVTNGSRGAAAPTSPQYREAAAKIAGKLAERYADHPGVVMWHIHNEYGAPVSHDYSYNARRAWPLWLQERYGTLDELFEALTLAQTRKVHSFPVALVGKQFWGPLADWLEGTLVEEGTINPEDAHMFKIVDTAEEAVQHMWSSLEEWERQDGKN